MAKVVDHEQRREQIALIVEQLLFENGLDELTLRSVARRAGFSTTIVCHYFQNKREMLAFTQRLARIRTIERVREAYEQGKEMPECLELALPADEETWRNWHTWFAFWGMAAAEPDIRSEWADNSSSANELFRDLVESAARKGQFDKKIDAKEAALNIQIIINGIATLAVQDADAWPRSRQCKLLKEHLGRIGYLGDVKADTAVKPKASKKRSGPKA